MEQQGFELAYDTEGTNEGATTLSIMTFSITTLSIKGLHVTLSISDAQQKQHSA